MCKRTIRRDIALVEFVIAAIRRLEQLDKSRFSEDFGADRGGIQSRAHKVNANAQKSFDKSVGVS